MKDTNVPVERIVDPCPKGCTGGCNYCVLQENTVPVEKKIDSAQDTPEQIIKHNLGVLEKVLPVEKWDWKQSFRLWAFHEENEKLALTGAQSINVERYFEKVLFQARQAAKEEERNRIADEFLKTTFRWVDLEDGDGKYLLASQVEKFIINKHQ